MSILRAVALVVASAPLNAFADQADTHFANGAELAEAGDVPEAEAEFEKAWAIRKAWDIAGNLGLTEAAQGKWEEAAEHLHFALQNIGSLATAEQRGALEDRYANVKARLGMVNVKSNVEVIIKIGTRTHASTQPLFLGEGKHQLECSAEGYEPVNVEVTTVKGETQSVKVELKKVGGTGPGSPSEERPSWPAVVLGVGGGLLLAGSIGSFVGAFVNLDDADTATASGRCSTDPACEDNRSSFDAANTLGGLGVAGLVTGAAALTGMAIYLAWPKNEGDGQNVARLSVRASLGAFVIEGSFQ